MVLEGTTQAADSFADDSYATSTTLSASSSYDSSTLAQPMPVLGPILGYSNARTRYQVITTLNYAEQKVHRPLTSDECQALATHLHTLEQAKSYFAATGLGLGLTQWYRTMGTNKYPFYTPKPESINPNKFAFFKGPAAQTARHSWRFFLYYSVSSRLGGLIGQVIAQPVAAQNTARDPRLAQFSLELKAAHDAESREAQGMREKMSKEFQATQQATRAAAGGNRSMGTIQKQTPVDDDMSPTAGNDPWPSASNDPWADSSNSYDSVQKPQPRQQPFSPSDTQSRRASRPTQDDASPTGGLLQDDVQTQGKPGESAWERLRRGGPPSSGQQRPPPSRGQPPHREQRDGSTLGDSFAFAESDEERQQAQERAQREFDARLERERQGKDFEEERKW